MSSTSSITSISPSTVSPTSPSQSKDFETAFGNLSASYGLHGIPSPTVTFTPQVPSMPSPLSFAHPTNIVPLRRHNTHSSEATLVQSNAARKTKRDYEAAFGALSSTYGIGGHIPALPSKHAKLADNASSKLRGFFWTRKTATKSRPLDGPISLTIQPSDIAKASYETAFGDLSSLYGTGGAIPSIPCKRMKLSPAGGQAHQPLPLVKAPSKLSPNENAAPEKDYNVAFGSLANSFGFYGCTQVPSMASKGSGF